jgi:hypothetical protein
MSFKGLKVVCPVCGLKGFETTENYDPAKVPNGSMVRSLLPYGIDWLTLEITPRAEMICPECGSELAFSGHLKTELPVNIVEELEEATAGDTMFVCGVCNRQFKSAFALNGHKRSHKDKKNDTVIGTEVSEM